MITACISYLFLLRWRSGHRSGAWRRGCLQDSRSVHQRRGSSNRNREEVQYELREEGTQARRDRLTGNRGIDEGLPEWIRELEGDAEGADDESRRSWKGCGGGGAAKGEAALRRARRHCEGRRAKGEAAQRVAWKAATRQRSRTRRRDRVSTPRVRWRFLSPPWVDGYWAIIHADPRLAKCKFWPNRGARPDVGFNPRETGFGLRSTPNHVYPNEA